MKKSEHNEAHCNTTICPRCSRVFELLDRFKLTDETVEHPIVRHTALFQLAEHCVDLEEATIAYNLEHFIPGRTTVAGTLEKVKLHVDNLAKCLAADNRMYLVNDVTLATMIRDPLNASNCLRDFCYLEVRAEGLTSEAKQPVIVHTVGEGHGTFSKQLRGSRSHDVQAQRLGWKLDKDTAWELASDDVVDNHLFNGTRHLVHLVDGELRWYGKNIVVTSYLLQLVGDEVNLLNPSFVCSKTWDTQQCNGD